MSKIKQMLLLKESGQSNRQAAKELGMDTDASRGFSPSTVAGQNAGEYIRHGMTVIMITHNLQWLDEYPGRVLKCEERHLTDLSDGGKCLTEEQPQNE